MPPETPLEKRVEEEEDPARTSPDLAPLEEERAVIERLQNGDRSAFATLFGWYGDKIYRQAILPRLPNRELAEDCLRDTFRTALEKIDTFQLTNRSVYFWLRRIAIHKAIDVHRAHQRDRNLADAVRAQPEPLTQSIPSPDRGLDLADTARLVNLSLDKLNPRYATALRLRLLEGQSREECAAALEVTVATFDVLFHRACKAFRQGYPP